LFSPTLSSRLRCIGWNFQPRPADTSAVKVTRITRSEISVGATEARCGVPSNPVTWQNSR
jgi:hypothetical protein